MNSADAMTVENEAYRAVEWLEAQYGNTYWMYGRLKATNWQRPMFEEKDMDKDGCENIVYTWGGERHEIRNCHCNNDDVIHNMWRMDWRPGFDMTEEEADAWVKSGRSHAHGWHPDRDEGKHEQPVPTADLNHTPLPASFGAGGPLIYPDPYRDAIAAHVGAGHIRADHPVAFLRNIT